MAWAQVNQRRHTGRKKAGWIRKDRGGNDRSIADTM